MMQQDEFERCQRALVGYTRSLNWRKINKYFKWIREEIQNSDPQKLMKHLDENAYLSPIEAYRIVRALSSLTIRLSETEPLLHFSMNFYHDIHYRHTTEYTSWAKYTFKMCFAHLSFFNKILFENQYKQSYYEFHFLTNLVEKFLTPIMEQLLSNNTLYMPTLAALACKRASDSLVCNKLKNQFLKKIMNNSTNRKLLSPIGGLTHLPHIANDQLCHEVTLSSCFDLSKNQSLVGFCFNILSAMNLMHRFNYIPEFSLPYNICYHSCQDCHTFCECPPCEICVCRPIRSEAILYRCKILEK